MENRCNKSGRDAGRQIYDQKKFIFHLSINCPRGVGWEEKNEKLGRRFTAFIGCLKNKLQDEVKAVKEKAIHYLKHIEKIVDEKSANDEDFSAIQSFAQYLTDNGVNLEAFQLSTFPALYQIYAPTDKTSSSQKADRMKEYNLVQRMKSSYNRFFESLIELLYKLLSKDKTLNIDFSRISNLLGEINWLMNKLSQHKDSVGLLVDPIPLATPLSQVVTSDQTVQGLREEIRRLQQTIHELESRAPPLPTPSLSVSSVDSQTMALENSREECKDLTHRLQGAEEEGKRLAMGMDALRADRDRLETECQSLRHTLSKQSKSIKTANSQRDSLQLRLDGINKDIGQWKEEILGMKTIIEEKNEEIARLNEEIERVHSQMKRLETENTSLLKEKERLLDNLDNEVKRVMEDRLDDVRVEYEAKISDMATRSHIEETKLSKEIKSLKEEIRQNEDYYSNLMHKLQVNSKRERANEIRNGDKVREACKLHSDNFKTDMMPWQFINTTAMCALNGHNNRYVLGYEEDQHYKIGIFDGENLEDFDKGYSCVLREQLPGPVLDVCALGKDKYAAIFSGENSSGTLLIGLGDSVSSVPVKFKSDYISGRKSSNPTSNSKILHWYNNCIYFLESMQRVAKLTEKLTKWTTEYLASSQKTLQEMTIADGVIYMISKTHLSRMEVSTGMEKTKDVCDSDFVLSTLHVSGDLVFCAASCFDKATRPKDQLVSVRIFVYTTDLVPISDILSEDFSDHVRYLHLVRGTGKNSTLIAIEGSDRPKIRFFSLDTKHSLTLVVNNDNIYKGIVNGMLMLEDRIVLYGQKRLSRIDNENLPNFRYLKFI